jgi:hypothetical protein
MRLNTEIPGYDTIENSLGGFMSLLIIDAFYFVWNWTCNLLMLSSVDGL